MTGTRWEFNLFTYFYFMIQYIEYISEIVDKIKQKQLDKIILFGFFP